MLEASSIEDPESNHLMIEDGEKNDSVNFNIKTNSAASCESNSPNALQQESCLDMEETKTAGTNEQPVGTENENPTPLNESNEKPCTEPSMSYSQDEAKHSEQSSYSKTSNKDIIQPETVQNASTHVPADKDTEKKVSDSESVEENSKTKDGAISGALVDSFSGQNEKILPECENNPCLKNNTVPEQNKTKENDKEAEQKAVCGSTVDFSSQKMEQNLSEGANISKSEKTNASVNINTVITTADPTTDKTKICIPFPRSTPNDMDSDAESEDELALHIDENPANSKGDLTVFEDAPLCTTSNTELKDTESIDASITMSSEKDRTSLNKDQSVNVIGSSAKIVHNENPVNDSESSPESDNSGENNALSPDKVTTDQNKIAESDTNQENALEMSKFNLNNDTLKLTNLKIKLQKFKELNRTWQNRKPTNDDKLNCTTDRTNLFDSFSADLPSSSTEPCSLQNIMSLGESKDVHRSDNSNVIKDQTSEQSLTETFEPENVLNDQNEASGSVEDHSKALQEELKSLNLILGGEVSKESSKESPPDDTNMPEDMKVIQADLLSLQNHQKQSDHDDTLQKHPLNDNLQDLQEQQKDGQLCSKKPEKEVQLEIISFQEKRSVSQQNDSSLQENEVQTQDSDLHKQNKRSQQDNSCSQKQVICTSDNSCQIGSSDTQEQNHPPLRTMPPAVDVVLSTGLGENTLQDIHGKKKSEPGTQMNVMSRKQRMTGQRDENVKGKESSLAEKSPEQTKILKAKQDDKSAKKNENNLTEDEMNIKLCEIFNLQEKPKQDASSHKESIPKNESLMDVLNLNSDYAPAIYQKPVPLNASDINWPVLGVKRCARCGFTTSDDAMLQVHTCRKPSLALDPNSSNVDQRVHQSPAILKGICQRSLVAEQPTSSERTKMLTNQLGTTLMCNNQLGNAKTYNNQSGASSLSNILGQPVILAIPTGPTKLPIPKLTQSSSGTLASSANSKKRIEMPSLTPKIFHNIRCKITYLGNNEFFCCVCNFSAYGSVFTSHIIEHMLQYPYSCPYCTSSGIILFQTLSEIRAHIKNHGNLPDRCTLFGCSQANMLIEKVAKAGYDFLPGIWIKGTPSNSLDHNNPTSSKKNLTSSPSSVIKSVPPCLQLFAKGLMPKPLNIGQISSTQLINSGTVFNSSPVIQSVPVTASMGTNQTQLPQTSTAKPMFLLVPNQPQLSLTSIISQPNVLPAHSTTTIQNTPSSSVMSTADQTPLSANKNPTNLPSSRSIENSKSDNHVKQPLVPDKSADGKIQIIIGKLGNKMVCTCKFSSASTELFRKHIWDHLHERNMPCAHNKSAPPYLGFCPHVNNMMSTVQPESQGTVLSQNYAVETNLTGCSSSELGQHPTQNNEKMDKETGENLPPEDDDCQIIEDEKPLPICVDLTEDDESNTGYTEVNAKVSEAIANTLEMDLKITDTFSLSSVQGNAPAYVSSGVTGPLSINMERKTPMEAGKRSSMFYVCGFENCLFSCTMYDQFKHHILANHRGAPVFPCAHCSYQSAGEEEFFRHMNTHTSSKMFLLYKCAFDRCRFGTNLISEFQQHNDIVHKDANCYACASCKAEHTALSKLIDHFQSVLLKFVQCPYCTVKSKDRRTILTHISELHPDKPRQITVTSQLACQHQNKEARRAQGTRSLTPSVECPCIPTDHVDQHNTTVPPSTAPTPHLRKERDMQNISEKFDLKTNKDHFISCATCSFKTTSVLKLDVHRAECSQYTTKNFVCPECLSGFEKLPQLSQHLIDHGIWNIQLYTCQLCKFSTNKTEIIEHHAKYTHPDENQTYQTSQQTIIAKELKCYLCPFVTKSQSEFNIHFTDHDVVQVQTESRSLDSITGDCQSKFCCPSCKKNYGCYPKFERHIALIHTEVNTVTLFRCRMCSFASTSVGITQKHWSQRHNGKPNVLRLNRKIKKIMEPVGTESNVDIFHCDQCDFSTNKRSEFSNHNLSHNSPENNGEKRSTEEASTTPTKGYLGDFKLPAESVFNSAIKCPECKYTTDIRVNLLRHMNYHKSWDSTEHKMTSSPIKINTPLRKFDSSLVKTSSNPNTPRVGPVGSSPKREHFYSCKLCSFRASSVQKVNLHLAHCKNKPKTVRKCIHCDYKCTSNTNLYIHHRKAHKELPFKGKQIAQKTSMENLSEISPPKRKALKIPESDSKKMKIVSPDPTERKNLSSQADIKEEAKVIDEMKRFTDSTSKEQKSLLCHNGAEKRIPRIQVKPSFKCEKCSTVTSSRASFDNHFKRIHGYKEDPKMISVFVFQCLDCGRKFRLKQDAESHNLRCIKRVLKESERTAAEEELNAVGDQEDDSCDTNLSVREADTVSTPVSSHVFNKKTYSCQICRDYTSRSRSHMKEHYYSHFDERPFNCPYCDYGTRRTLPLVSHMKMKHPDEEQHVQENKKLHQKIEKMLDLKQSTSSTVTVPVLPPLPNADDNSYKIKESERTAAEELNAGGDEDNSSDTNLSAREADAVSTPLSSPDNCKSPAFEKKSFSCHLCHYGSPSRSHINEHYYSHFDEHPFNCPYCDYGTRRTLPLLSHIRMKHPDKNQHVQKNEKLHQNIKKLIDTKKSTSIKIKVPVLSSLANADNSGIKQEKYTPVKASETLHKQHDPSNPYHCKLCSFTFANKKSFKGHEKRHRPEKLKCAICDFEGVFPYLMRNHFCKYHPGDEVSYNQVVHAKEIDSDEQTQEHVDDKEFVVIADEDTESKLQAHFPLSGIYVRFQDPSNRSAFRCKICDLRCHSSSLIAAHVYTHMPQCFQCIHCDYKSYPSSAITGHIKSSHEGWPIKCKYYRNEGLYGYNQLLSRIGKPPYKIVTPKKRKLSDSASPGDEVTGKGVKRRSRAAMILMSDSESDSYSDTDVNHSTIFCCHLCNFKSEDITKYCEHLALHETFMNRDVSRKSKCGFCSFSSHDPNEFQNHVATHVSERPFKCSHCGYSCFSKNSILGHLKCKHTAEEISYLNTSSSTQGGTSMTSTRINLNPALVVVDTMLLSEDDLDSLMEKSGISSMGIKSLSSLKLVQLMKTLD